MCSNYGAGFRISPLRSSKRKHDSARTAGPANSGGLHAGIYYAHDSLKSKFWRDGNRELTEYCLERKLKLNRCGKLVVAHDASELKGLDELFRRGQTNAVELRSVSAQEAREIEPRVRTFEPAIFSPPTSSVDPREVVASLARDAAVACVTIISGVGFVKRRNEQVVTTTGRFTPGYVVNCAGLYADVVAREFGFCLNHRILPFKGVYLYGKPGEKLRTNIYPVPPLKYPFLGVHFTIAVDGTTKIGPTAIPALWREQYGGFTGFSVREFGEIAVRELNLFLRNSFGFRDLAFSDIPKYRRSVLVGMARRMIPDIDANIYRQWGRPGIRAQLLNTREGKLEMDFKVEGNEKSFHVLNAVSPAFTSSLPFARYVVHEISRLCS